MEKLRKAIEESKGLDVAKAGQYTLGQWMRVWYENYASIKVRPSSHATYMGIIKNHIDPAIGDIPLTKLTTLDLQKFYRDLLTGGRVERKGVGEEAQGPGPEDREEYPPNHFLRLAAGYPPEAHPSQPGGGMRPAKSGTERDENPHG